MGNSQDNPWSHIEVITIPAGQKSYDAHLDIQVPTDVNGAPISEGYYHFGVYAGNEEQAFLKVHNESDDHDDEH